MSSSDADLACCASQDDAPLLRRVVAPSRSQWEWITSICCALSYACTYFWRYPAFVLPPDVLDVPVRGGFTLRSCISFAFIGGFAAAKLPAAHFASSRLFFRHRRTLLLSLITSSMLIEGAGLAAPHPAAKVGAVFASAFLSSFLWGCMLTYLEGRVTTERHVALATLCLIYAGNASRGAGSAFLSAGVSPAAMPLAVGACALTPSAALLLLLDRAPRPSAADVAARTARRPMGGEARRAFLRRWACGLAPLCVAYALLTGVRSLRDLFADQLFAASLGAPGGAAPGWILWTADLPGALVSAATLVAFGRIRDSHRAMQAMLSVMIAATCLALVATGAWQLGLLGGGSWQLLLGTGVFLCSGRRGAPCAVTRDWSTRGGRLS
uniref:Uncharacterized protein n=1 Tax=Emiliania huxleyi TaxID=2903 RepID=A0A7S3SFW2_EMIHU|mmetsp:Transcript_30626/g.90955  ORF Transcript_30626/g.90955 Transcript_30626/m.90955 type:complete len:382 (+) Transcript_30626:70-1215(+)